MTNLKDLNHLTVNSNDGFFEELTYQQTDLFKECVYEPCVYEELSEAFTHDTRNYQLKLYNTGTRYSNLIENINSVPALDFLKLAKQPCEYYNDYFQSKNNERLCENFATRKCISEWLDKTCICHKSDGKDLFSGNYCETCHQNCLKNDGKCVYDENLGENLCQCRFAAKTVISADGLVKINENLNISGWTHSKYEFCDVKKNFCEDENACVNGICNNTDFGFSCQCLPGFEIENNSCVEIETTTVSELETTSVAATASSQIPGNVTEIETRGTTIKNDASTGADSSGNDQTNQISKTNEKNSETSDAKNQESDSFRINWWLIIFIILVIFAVIATYCMKYEHKFNIIPVAASQASDKSSARNSRSEEVEALTPVSEKSSIKEAENRQD